MQPAQDPSRRQARLSRTLKDLRSHLRPVKALQILINARPKNCAPPFAEQNESARGKRLGQEGVLAVTSQGA